jgi:hypothetical protein
VLSNHRQFVSCSRIFCAPTQLNWARAFSKPIRHCRAPKTPLPRLATLLRKALPAQALAITGTAKYLRRAKAARIVAECGAGKTFMALGTIHVLAEGGPVPRW